MCFVGCAASVLSTDGCAGSGRTRFFYSIWDWFVLIWIQCHIRPWFQGIIQCFVGPREAATGQAGGTCPPVMNRAKTHTDTMVSHPCQLARVSELSGVVDHLHQHPIRGAVCCLGDILSDTVHMIDIGMFSDDLVPRRRPRDIQTQKGWL